MRNKIQILVALTLLMSASVSSQNQKTIDICGSPVNFSWGRSGIVGTFPPAPGLVYGVVSGVTVNSGSVRSGQFNGIVAKQCAQTNLPQGEIQICGVPLSFSLASTNTFPPAPGQIYGKAVVSLDSAGNMTNGSFAGVVAKVCELGDLVRVYRHHWYGWSEDQSLDYTYPNKSQ